MNLVEQFKAGSKRSFESLFDQYFHRLCSFGFRYLGDYNESEDLVQEAFVSLWEKKADFDHPQAIKSFLYTAVRNKCLNVLKHRLVKQSHEQAIVQELEEDAYFDHAVIEEDVLGQLYAEISQLPEGSRKIMALALQGLKNHEIAAELDISENTVKTQKKIAYSKLKSKMSLSLYPFLLIV